MTAREPIDIACEPDSGLLLHVSAEACAVAVAKSAESGMRKLDRTAVFGPHLADGIRIHRDLGAISATFPN
jgi:hypothetical protein